MVFCIIQEILSTPHYVDPLAEEGKAELVKEMQDVYAALDSAEWCKFTSMAVFSTLKCISTLVLKVRRTFIPAGKLGKEGTFIETACFRHDIKLMEAAFRYATKILKE